MFCWYFNRNRFIINNFNILKILHIKDHKKRLLVGICTPKFKVLFSFDISSWLPTSQILGEILGRAGGLYNSQRTTQNSCPRSHYCKANSGHWESNNDILHIANTKISSVLQMCEVQMASECKKDKTGTENSSDESQTDSICAGFKLDMTKIVDDVKINIKQKRMAKKMQENYSNNQFGSSSFGLQDFGDSRSSCDEENKMKNENVFSSSYVSDDSNENETNIATNEKKVRKSKKQNKMSKNEDDDSFGLKWLFDENKQKKRKRKIQKNNSGMDDSNTETKIKRKRPNYFVAIRVSNPQTHVTVKDFQDSILKENKKLKAALIPLPTLHLTMAVMHIDDKILIETAKNALEKSKTTITDILETVDFKIKFLGIGDFQNEVVFAKVQEEYIDCLKNINNVVTSAFQDSGIIMDDKEWKAHLTLLKLSRNGGLRKKGIKKISKELYSSWTDSYFGEEQISSINLCSMFEPKESDGYYKCVVNISLNRSDASKTELLKDMDGETITE